MNTKKILFSVVLLGSVATLVSCGGHFKQGNFGDKMFSKYDENNDNYVDKNEYIEVSISRFDRTDDNEDGKVSKEESRDSFIAKRFPQKINQWFEKRDLNNDNYVSSEENKQQTESEFTTQDANKDGKLSKDEMSKYRENERFQAIDTDGNKSISKQEFSNMKKPF